MATGSCKPILWESSGSTKPAVVHSARTAVAAAFSGPPLITSGRLADACNHPDDCSRLERDEDLLDLLWNWEQKCKYKNPGIGLERKTPMSDANINVKLTQYERPEHIFPTLSGTQMARILAHGKKRAVQAGEVLVEPGDNNLSFFLVTLGAMEITRPTCEGEDRIAVHQVGQFFGEVGILSGRRSMVRARMREAGEVIEVDHLCLQELIETDSELSEILMRAFILRRVEFIAHGWGDAVLLGTNNSSGTLRIKEFLTRNGYPHAYVDLEDESNVQEMLDHFQVTAGDVPIVICRGKNVLRNPTNQEVADCLGFNEGIDLTKVRDVIVVGAGPAGLAAAGLGASGGVDVVGGGTAAGKPAVFLSQTAKHVHMLIRSGRLADTMSRYLIRRIEESEAITLHTDTEVVGLRGNGRLDQVLCRNNKTGALNTRDIR